MDITNYKITKIADRVELSNWASVQDCIVEEQESQYPNSLKIQFYWDKIMMLNWKKEWDIVDCKLNFRTRESKGNYYTSISCRSMKKVQTVQDKMEDRSNEQARNLKVWWEADLPF